MIMDGPIAESKASQKEPEEEEALWHWMILFNIL